MLGIQIYTMCYHFYQHQQTGVLHEFFAEKVAAFPGTLSVCHSEGASAHVFRKIPETQAELALLRDGAGGYQLL
jgi:hypothetical protein